MNPETIVFTVGQVASAIAEGFKWAQTTQGQAVIQRGLEDRATFDKGIRDIAEWFTKLFKGQL